MMATSVVPPPISTIIDAVASAIAARRRSRRHGLLNQVHLRAPARSAESNTARFSTAVIPDGIEMTTLGPMNPRPPLPLRMGSS